MCSYSDQEAEYILRAYDRRLGRTPSEKLRNMKKRKQQADYQSGVFYGTIAIAFIVLMFAIFAIMEFAAIIFFGIAIWFIPSIVRYLVMNNWLEKISLVKIVNMKLEALTNYLKVHFIHIPEHYECVKNKEWKH